MTTPIEPVALEQIQIDDLLSIDEGAGIIFAKFVATFNTNMPNGLALLRTLATTGDFPQIAFNAHKMQGAAGNLGASRLAQAFRKLEHAATANDDTEMQPLLDLLDAEYTAARSALQAELALLGRA